MEVYFFVRSHFIFALGQPMRIANGVYCILPFSRAGSTTLQLGIFGVYCHNRISGVAGQLLSKVETLQSFFSSLFGQVGPFRSRDVIKLTSTICCERH